MKVRDIMREDVVWIRQDATLQDVVVQLGAHFTDLLPVVDEAHRFKGFITAHDLVEIFLPRYPDLVRDYASIDDAGMLESLFSGSRVELDGGTRNLFLAVDAMNLQIPPLRDDDNVLRAAARFQALRLHRLPVVNAAGELVGMLTDTAIPVALLGGRPKVHT